MRCDAPAWRPPKGLERARHMTRMNFSEVMPGDVVMTPAEGCDGRMRILRAVSGFHAELGFIHSYIVYEVADNDVRISHMTTAGTKLSKLVLQSQRPSILFRTNDEEWAYGVSAIAEVWGGASMRYASPFKFLRMAFRSSVPSSARAARKAAAYRQLGGQSLLAPQEAKPSIQNKTFICTSFVAAVVQAASPPGSYWDRVRATYTSPVGLQHHLTQSGWVRHFVDLAPQ